MIIAGLMFTLAYHTMQPPGFVILSEEVFDAAKDVATHLDGKFGIKHTLIKACIASGASTPSYKLWFREHSTPVCVERPWRLYSWWFDLDTTCECERTTNEIIAT